MEGGGTNEEYGEKLGDQGSFLGGKPKKDGDGAYGREAQKYKITKHIHGPYGGQRRNHPNWNKCVV